MSRDKTKCYYCGQDFVEGEDCPHFKNKSRPHVHEVGYWQAEWRKDKTTKKYKEYLKKREKAMKKATRERLDKLHKAPLSKKEM